MDRFALSELSARRDKPFDCVVAIASREGRFGAADDGIVLIDASRQRIDEGRNADSSIRSSRASQEARRRDRDKDG